jgi:microcystin-dependent protein
MKYIYILLVILVLYYLFLNIYQKYSNQENFDPSLVPVSSIVTLAKVAQKLVNGGGTLTNPGNLQIGIPSAGGYGNLIVTGTNTVNGVSTFNNPVTVNGTTTFNGDNTLTGTQTITGISNVSGNINTASKIQENGFNLIPTGIIVAYNGITAPSGWALCDGTNGTPDLRGRFIRMVSDPNTERTTGNLPAVISKNVPSGDEIGLKSAGREGGLLGKTAILSHSFGDQGGSDYVQLIQNELAAHTHGVTDPSHAHVYPVRRWADDNNHSDGSMASASDNPNGDNNSYPGTWGAQTGISINNTGGNWGHSNIPPYYVLVYIMKL